MAEAFDLAPERRRRRRNKAFAFLVMIPALVFLVLLISIVAQVAVKGLKVLSPAFFLEAQKPFGDPGGGIANGILGSILTLVVASLIGIPLSLGAALFLSERRGTRLAKVLRVVIDSFQGLPSIVLGVVMYIWLVVPAKTFSALAGGAALALIMLPATATAIFEVLLLVPPSYAEAAIALGAPRWRASLGIVVPAAKAGILNGIGLGIARAAGETAPLLFTAFGNPFINLNPAKPTSAIPLIIYDYMKSPYPDWQAKAWGGALLLVLFVFVVNLLIAAERPRGKDYLALSRAKGQKSSGRPSSTA